MSGDTNNKRDLMFVPSNEIIELLALYDKAARCLPEGSERERYLHRFDILREQVEIRRKRLAKERGNQ